MTRWENTLLCVFTLIVDVCPTPPHLTSPPHLACACAPPGLLDLHTQPVPVASFVRETVGMFNVQARECGVALRIIMGPKLVDKRQSNLKSSLIGMTMRRPAPPGGGSPAKGHRLAEPSQANSDAAKSVYSASSSKKRHADAIRAAAEPSFTDLDMVPIDKFKMEQVRSFASLG